MKGERKIYTRVCNRCKKIYKTTTKSHKTICDDCNLNYKRQKGKWREKI